MSTATLVPLQEYLETSYRPDCDYLEGELRERNVGEGDHSRLQGRIVHYLIEREEEWRIFIAPEQRVQVKRDRYRVPDIVVLTQPPTEQVLRTPPFLCVEILSRGDSMSDMQERIDDYLELGVPYVWVVNPKNLRAYVYTAEGMKECRDGVLTTENPEIRVPLSDLG